VQELEALGKKSKTDIRDLKAQLQSTSERRDELEILATVYRREISDLKQRLKRAELEASMDQRQTAKGLTQARTDPGPTPSAENPLRAIMKALYVAFITNHSEGIMSSPAFLTGAALHLGKMLLQK
jgi:chromosome segregation ATPase